MKQQTCLFDLNVYLKYLVKVDPQNARQVWLMYDQTDLCFPQRASARWHDAFRLEVLEAPL